MEYEIEDETRLFDDSTNPSLKRRQGAPSRETTVPRERRKLQKAELIPEEEDQAA